MLKSYERMHGLGLNTPIPIYRSVHYAYPAILTASYPALSFVERMKSFVKIAGVVLSKLKLASVEEAIFIQASVNSSSTYQEFVFSTAVRTFDHHHKVTITVWCNLCWLQEC